MIAMIAIEPGPRVRWQRDSDGGWEVGNVLTFRVGGIVGGSIVDCEFGSKSVLVQRYYERDVVAVLRQKLTLCEDPHAEVQ